MNQSKQSSKWSALLLTLAFFGFGGTSYEMISAQSAGGEDGWFNPEKGIVQVKDSEPITTLELTFDDEDTDDEIESVAYMRRVPNRRRAPVQYQRGQRPRRVAMAGEEELNWSFDEEEPVFSAAPTAPKKSANLPAETEALPKEAVSAGTPEPEFTGEDMGVGGEEPGFPANEAEWDHLTQKGMREFEQPTFEPETAESVDETASPAGTSSEEGHLPQANTQIDHFGNIGYVENNTAKRTEDGGQTCNPYSDGVFDFHPLCFPWDPMHQTHTRVLPPPESFGTDGYGNNAVVCDEYGCYQSCCGSCCGCFGALLYALRTTELSAGAFAFQPPVGGVDSNFGVDLGVNWSTPCRLFGLVGQLGGRYLRSGRAESTSDEDDYYRTQGFFTAGLFFRNPGSILKFGAAYDSLRDETEWKYTIGQLRSEVSCRLGEMTDAGFRGAFQLGSKDVELTYDDESYQAEVSALSYYTGFVRHTFVTGAEGTISCGVTEDKDALLGCRIEVPVTNHSTIRNSFTYVFPTDKDRRNDDQAWSASISWVVYLGGSSHVGLASPFKPLFDVADNTSFLQKTK